MKSITFLSFITFCTISLLAMLPNRVDAQRNQDFITAQNIKSDIVPRIAHSDAEAGITTREGSVDLMISNEYIVIQFTDRFLENIETEINREKEATTSHAGSVLFSMIGSGVRTLLDRAIAVPFSEINEIYYENGRLYIISREGTELFKDLDIDGKEVMEDFSRRDARRFVAEAEKRLI